MNYGFKNWGQDFDVPMGCDDVADVCELEGTHILNKFRNVINKENIGLYRDETGSISKYTQN